MIYMIPINVKCGDEEISEGENDLIIVNGRTTERILSVDEITNIKSMIASLWLLPYPSISILPPPLKINPSGSGRYEMCKLDV